MKIYNRLTKEIRWEDDISDLLSDIHWEMMDVLAEKSLNGHDEYDQWLMAVERDLRRLLNTLAERDYSQVASKNETIIL